MLYLSRLMMFALLATPPVAAQGTWTTLAPMPTAREAAGVARTPDGTIYVIGGDAFSGTYVPTSAVEAYNPATNTWSSKAPMPTARYGLAAAYSNGKIFAFGGYSPFSPRNTVEAYDPATNTWATAASMPSARHGLRAVTGNDGRIYVIGGDASGGGANVATLEIYDPVTNSWSIGPAMPNAKIGPGAVLGDDGLIYVMGGGEHGIRVASMFAYDPVANAWSIKNSMAIARAGLATAKVPDGRIVAIGGENAGGISGVVEIYDPVANSWSAGSSITTPRANLGAATGNDGRIYAIGGWVPVPGGLMPLTVNEAYSIAPLPPPPPQFQICALYDATKAVKSGATIPIKIQLCDTSGNNLSASNIVVHATGLTLVSNNSSTDIQDAGNANPDFDFRYDSTLGGSGGYIFNLKTTGLKSGTYKLSFTAGASPTTYSVQFQVK